MIYCYSILTPKNTAAWDPTIKRMKLTAGIVHKIEIIFPPGCVGLVGVSIRNAIHQVWPTNPEEQFFGDGETISYREHLPLLDDPHEMQVYLTNADDTYGHTITIRIGILPTSVIAPWLQSYADRLAAALGTE